MVPSAHSNDNETKEEKTHVMNMRLLERLSRLTKLRSLPSPRSAPVPILDRA